MGLIGYGTVETAYGFIQQSPNHYKYSCTMQKKTRSLLEEFDDLYSSKDCNAVVESRASHVVKSAINLLKVISEQYDPDVANELERRLLLSIKNRDYDKFLRGINKVNESKIRVVQGKKTDES